MLTDEGKFYIGLILFLFGIFLTGYFVGWSRNKLAGKIFDKMIDYWTQIGRLEDHLRLLERRLTAKDKELEELKKEEKK